MLLRLLPLVLTLTPALAADPEPPSGPADWNVLFLTVDALRPDRMGLYGHDRDTTPYLEQLSSEAAVFDKAFANGAWTSPGVVSMVTGTHPPMHGQGSRFDVVDPTLRTPLDVLRGAGWRTIARDTGGPTIEGLGYQWAYLPALHDEVEIAEWLTHQERKWVAWVHIKPTHLPYQPTPYHLRRFDGDRLQSPALDAVRTSGTVYPKDYGLSWNPPVIASFTPEEQAVVRDLYDGAVAKADDMLGRMIETLRQAGTLDRTVLVITADHGEELFDHGWVGHASTGYQGKVYDELIHIPLIVRVPDGLGAGVRTQALVQQSDLMPTVFDLLGQDPSAPDGGFQGASLRGLLSGEQGGHDVVFARTTFKGWTCPQDELRDGATAARTADRKLIRLREGGVIRHEAYDLADDPDELRDLWGAQPERFSDLVQALDSYDEQGQDGASQLMLLAAERHVQTLQQAARDKDPVLAAGEWLELQRLRQTYDNEWSRPLDDRQTLARWQRLIRRARALRDQAGDGAP